MAINPSITSTLSTALSTGLSGTRAVSTAAFARPNVPQKQINPLENNPGPALQFPQDRPKYYMILDIYNYKRESLQSIGKLTPESKISSIVLPLANQIRDSHHVQWNDSLELGTILGYGMDKLWPMVQNQSQSTLTQTGLAIGLAAAAGGVQGTGLGQILNPQNPATGAVGSLMGYSPNQFMTVMLSGPTFKRHQFEWSLSPRNFGEANTLRQIVNACHNFQSPNKALGGLVWNFPKIFWISFMPNSKFLFKFKPAILENFTVDYTPGNRAAFYHDVNSIDNSGGNNPPQGITFSMKFIELEFWLEGDYNDSNDPHNVYTAVEGNNPNITGLENDVNAIVNSAHIVANNLINNVITTPAQ